MSKYKLSEIFDLQMGKTPSRNNELYWKHATEHWVSIADLSSFGKYTKQTKEMISLAAVKESGIKQIPKNTVIMSFKLSLGKTAITSEKLYTNEAIMAFQDKGITEIDVNYIYYLFSGKDWSKGTNRAVLGATLNKATLSDIEIPLPPLSEQQKIADTLDKVSHLIALRKEQLRKLDLLVKARFVEMFGDETFNVVALSTVCVKITDGTHQSPQFLNKGVPFLLVSNIVNNKISYQTNKYISKDEHAILNQRIPIELGDVLLTTVGSYGNPAVVETKTPFAFQRHIGYIKPRKKILNSYYLHAFFLSPYGQKQIEERVKGVAQKTLNLSELKAIDIPLPPLPLQAQFADYVAQVETSKEQIQQGLEKLETLYKGLMQGYFN